MCLNQKLERGPDLAGYAEWKSAISLEACPSSEARIQEVSSSVPSYPVQWTRYNSLQAQCRLSILGSRISEISNSSSSNVWRGQGLNTIGNHIQSCWFQH